MYKFSKILLLPVIFTTFFLTVSAQKKPRKPAAKKPPAAVKKPTAETPQTNAPPKKNERPADADSAVQTTADEPQKTNQNSKNNQRPAVQTNDNFAPDYFYEFSQPAFTISKITITHDADGKGKISFLRQNYEEPVSDPVQLSAKTLGKLKTAFEAVKYFEAGENYQYEKDYSHLGNYEIRVKKDGQTRSTKFNYTTNKNAKTLADEYYHISQQYIWIFDMNVARVNQPLETPGLMDTLDGYFTRNEISDPEQMMPFLKELSNDERLPLIARNHAARMIKKVEKTK